MERNVRRESVGIPRETAGPKSVDGLARVDQATSSRSCAGGSDD